MAVAVFDYDLWAARYPEQVPQINGEFEYLAAFTPEVRG